MSNLARKRRFQLEQKRTFLDNTSFTISGRDVIPKGFAMLIAAVGQYFFGIAIFVSSMFLIMLVLVQRGRGGGLAGALGGPGGQSAFGTKAGDLFTKITIGVASFWILLCVIAVVALKEKTLDTGVTRPDATIQSRSGAGDRDAIVPPTDGLSPGSTVVPPSGPSTSPLSLPSGSQTPPIDLATPGTVSPRESSSATEGAEVTELGADTDPAADEPTAEGGADSAASDEGTVSPGEASPGEAFPENSLRPAESNDPPADPPAQP